MNGSGTPECVHTNQQLQPSPAPNVARLAADTVTLHRVDWSSSAVGSAGAKSEVVKLRAVTVNNIKADTNNIWHAVIEHD